ncbi:thioredoxin family protein [Gillisia sp. M10.2A]|uniref:Thioredoxin family protein n=1 Tax=Gillisia lutea TaxID=2909668 RepID=A0ABS9EI67_9FLAO|nr:thioredoxin family protein [Gillisia lutea]MCF4102531.1 thioredoxin family protein [Gillisia lutea]
MKKIFLLNICLLFSVFLVNAQEWETDLEQAKKIAAQENRDIILVFQGSDWCAPCIKLDHEIWSSKTFKTYANEHYVLLKADFPRRQKNALDPEQQAKNNKLAEIYNKQGYFPFVVILDKSGKVLGKTGYKKMTPEEYIKHLNALKG